MKFVSLAQHSAWLGAGERPEKPSYSKRTARPQPRYMPACGAENGASTIPARFGGSTLPPNPPPTGAPSALQGSGTETTPSMGSPPGRRVGGKRPGQGQAGSDRVAVTGGRWPS